MKIKHLIILAASSALAFTGCKDAVEYTPSIYITEAQVDMAKTIKVAGAGETIEFTVSSSRIVDRDTHVSLEVHPELVAEYNKLSGRPCETIDDYEFLEKQAVIKAGKNVSDPIEIAINQTVEPGKFYCLPIKISGTDGTMPILEPSSLFYLVCRAPTKGNVIYLGENNMYIVPQFYNYTIPADGADPSALPEATLECRVMAESFQEADPLISSIMGVEGNLALRFGDVKIDPNILQVCKGDYQPAATTAPCSKKKWYHVAGVWSRTSLKVYIDGKLITEAPHDGSTIDLTQKPDGSMLTGFNIGAASVYQGGRPLDGYVAEARVWTRALSGAEIANIKELVSVDPQSPDLLAYWKMDRAEEAPGTDYLNPIYQTYNKVIDITGHGFDAYGKARVENIKTIEAEW